jgi:hypothetical protein
MNVPGPQLDSTGLLAFARLVPAPELSDQTESAHDSRATLSSYVRDDAQEAETALEREADPDDELDPVVAVTAADRRLLLARKFARKHMSDEHVARLEILEERLRALVPQVTEQAVARLEEARSRIAATDDLLERVRRELSTEK